MQVDKQHFYLQSILDRLKNDFTPEAHNKGLQFLVRDCRYVVVSDPTLLELILRNLVSNAIRYTERGEVRVHCEAVADKLRIQISDTGIGIPVDEQQRIFEEFHQLNNPERDRSKGLGLGLAIVRRTADLLQHHLNVVSEYGSGSVFTLAVELGNGESARRDAAPLIPEPMATDTPLLFIVIDDEQSVRDGMQERLRLWGYAVITAADQKQALELLAHTDHSPDGIIADYRLRENHTGIEAIRAIQAVYGADIPALIITGDTAVEQLREVNDSGYLILHKPVAPAKLRAFLRSVQRHN
jgi:CheY-like chemotaxis protein/anti-sigma regulatory factor (Ser/Thr protein kinase)